MPYIGTQPNDVKKNTGLYTPSEILQLTKEGSWGGSLELIEEQTYSSTVSVVDFLNIKEDIFDVHYMTFSNMQTSVDNQDVLNFRFFESGVLESASVYFQSSQTTSAISGLEAYERRSQSASAINYLFGTGTVTGEQAVGSAFFYNLGNSSLYSLMTGSFMGLSNSGLPMQSFGGANLPQASTVDGIRVMKNTGNYADFTIRLYGIKELWVI